MGLLCSSQQADSHVRGVSRRSWAAAARAAGEPGGQRPWLTSSLDSSLDLNLNFKFVEHFFKESKHRSVALKICS
jgi:hypothetical protein